MRITQSSSYLNNLLRQVRAGELFPASFQRPYVWTKEDVLSLLTSLSKGYPIGSVLSWTPPRDTDWKAAGNGRLGPIVQSPDSRRISLLLDGQNRLATLAWVADPAPAADLVLGDIEASTWRDGSALILDLKSGEFRFVPENQAAVGLTMPAHAMLHSPTAMRVMRERYDNEWAKFTIAEREAGLKVYDDLSQRFLNAQVAHTDLAGATAAEALAAFRHICRAGVPMSDEDFAKALRWAL